MLSYVVKRLLQGGFVLFLVSLLTFVVMFLMPGDPARRMVGQARVTDEQLEAIRERWNLNDSFAERYWAWISNLVTGDLGTSMMRPGVTISQMIGDAAGMTLRLTVLSFVFSLCLAIPIGMLAAMKRYSLFDYISMLGSTLGIAVPNYWIGLMLIIVFSVNLGWVPPYGSASWQAYILPVLVLSIEEMAALARLTRGATIEVMNQDYVVTARAKGLARNVIMVRHVVRNALLPIITILGYRMAFILSGTIVIETVFAWPGIGRLFFDAIVQKDLQVVQAIVLLLTGIIVVVNIVTDLTYAVIDPRVRIR
ncbi:MAG: ABC transporter permease [Thermomicrobiales bacterium]